MVRFVEYLDTQFRVLNETKDGIWIISYTNPASPFFVSENLKRIETPSDFVSDITAATTAALQKRLELIAPLTEDDLCITNAEHRRQVADNIAAHNKTTRKRVLRLYYRYLATGSPFIQKQQKEEPKQNEVFDWAIRRYYYSAKKFSLKATWELMLLERYTEDGKLKESHPSFSAFQHYFYQHDYHKNPQKTIARQGLSYYQRNERPAFGSARDWRSCIGSYQIDEQEADLFLVSEYDRSQSIGRPHIYLAVDTATEMITGLHVTMDCGDAAVARLVANAAGNKVTFCEGFEIEISESDWPVMGMPRELITDKGNDFCGKRSEAICYRYGVDIQSVPPFRSEQKPLIERTFGLLNDMYKSLLRGKGVAESDVYQRWAVNYKSQSVLTLHEFTQILIYCILHLNKRVLENGDTPTTRWARMIGVAGLLETDDKALYLMSLGRTTKKVTLSKTGFRFRRLQYAPESMDGLYIKDAYSLAWDENDCSYVYAVIGEEQYVRCNLIKDSTQYQQMTFAEVASTRETTKTDKSCNRQNELDSKIDTINKIKTIIDSASQEAGK